MHCLWVWILTFASKYVVISWLYRYLLYSLNICPLYFGFIYIRILFGFPQKLFDCENFGRPNEICEMADTNFGLASEVTTRYTCVMYCNATFYSKLSCISAKIKGFLFYISWFARALYRFRMMLLSFIIRENQLLLRSWVDHVLKRYKVNKLKDTASPRIMCHDVTYSWNGVI